MNKDQIASEIASALRWADEDIATTGGLRWNCCNCEGLKRVQYMRSWVSSPAIDDPWLRGWRVYTVSVVVPEHGLELVRSLMSKVADRVSDYGICERQCTYVDAAPLVLGGAMAIVYIDKVWISKDPCLVAVIAFGTFAKPTDKKS